MEKKREAAGGGADAREGMLEKLKAQAKRDEAARARMREEAARGAFGRRAGGERHGRRRGAFMWRLIVLAVLILAILCLLAFFAPRLRETLRLDVELPSSVAELLPDSELGYNKFQFQEAILGETREKSELVVLEQDVQASTEISQALANIALFEKTQTLISYGTGVYAVDLSGIGAEQITLDEAARLVTVTIPHARLAYVSFDVNKTESGQTKRALFGFGDIKLTTEQMTILESSVDEAMRSKLSAPEALAAADERALLCVRELLDPLVKRVAAEYAVKTVMQ